MSERLKNKTILYVDDYEEIRNITGMILNRYFAQVYTASNGKEAFEVYEHVKPDYVVTDIEMPQINGIELIKQIKSKYPQQPILVVTAYDDDKHKPEEADGIMIKPVSTPELIQMLETIDR